MPRNRRPAERFQPSEVGRLARRAGESQDVQARVGAIGGVAGIVGGEGGMPVPDRGSARAWFGQGSLNPFGPRELARPGCGNAALTKSVGPHSCGCPGYQREFIRHRGALSLRLSPRIVVRVLPGEPIEISRTRAICLIFLGGHGRFLLVLSRSASTPTWTRTPGMQLICDTVAATSPRLTHSFRLRLGPTDVNSQWW